MKPHASGHKLTLTHMLHVSWGLISYYVHSIENISNCKVMPSTATGWSSVNLGVNFICAQMNTVQVKNIRVFF